MSRYTLTRAEREDAWLRGKNVCPVGHENTVDSEGVCSTCEQILNEPVNERARNLYDEGIKSLLRVQERFLTEAMKR